jgi:hypothetical protein
MQYYVGMMQHGDGMVPRQSNGWGLSPSYCIGVILSRQAAKAAKIQPRKILHEQHELRNLIVVAG